MRSKLKVIAYLCISVLMFECGSVKTAARNEGWETMFNGRDLDNWTTKINHYEVGDNYGHTFRVEDNMIMVRYDHYEDMFNDRFGHLYFNRPYAYFHLTLEYRFVGELYPGAPSYTIKNSGVMFHSQDPNSILVDQNWPISVEMQLLAGIDKRKQRPTANMCSPGTDVVYDGQIDPRHCINSSSETYFRKQWVKAELIVLGDSLITHVINGKNVLQYTKPQMGGGVVNGFDPNIWEEGKLLDHGFIALQSEGQPIDFRHIKIRNLKGCMNPSADNYKDYFIKSDPGSCIYK